MTDERIAAGLSDRLRQVILNCEPTKVTAPVADLLSLVLERLADTANDNTVYLTDLGLAVRAILEKQA